MHKPTDSELSEFSRPDVLHVLDCTEEALRLAKEHGSVSMAHAFAEKKVATAFNREWRPSLYKWAGIVLAFRRAVKPTDGS